MDKWTYTILNIGFFIPLILLFWFGIYRKIFFKRWKFMLVSGLLGAVYFFTVDLLATSQKAWEYDYSMTLGIMFGRAALEELIWMILVFVTIALMIEVLLQRPEDTLLEYCQNEHNGIEFDFYDHEKAWPFWQKEFERKKVWTTPELKKALKPFRMSATHALAAYQKEGKVAGHVCSIFKSTPYSMSAGAVADTTHEYSKS